MVSTIKCHSGKENELFYKYFMVYIHHCAELVLLAMHFRLTTISGTTSVLLDSLDDALENPGVRPLSRKVEIVKLIQTFRDVYYGYPLCQKSPRLLPGTTSVILDPLMTLWRTGDHFPRR